MFTSGLTVVEAWLIGLSAFSLIGLGVIVWLSLREHAPAAAAPSVPQVAFEAAALQLDGQATAILDLVRTYLDAGERYSVTLAQAGKDLPALATPTSRHHRQVPARRQCQMQHEAGELKSLSVEVADRSCARTWRGAGDGHASPTALSSAVAIHTSLGRSWPMRRRAAHPVL
jgi:hypothetical protein